MLTISKAQASRLWAIAYKELGLKEREVRTVFLEFGVTSTTQIPANQYEQVLSRLREYAQVCVCNQVFIKIGYSS